MARRRDAADAVGWTRCVAKAALHAKPPSDKAARLWLVPPMSKPPAHLARDSIRQSSDRSPRSHWSVERDLLLGLRTTSTPAPTTVVGRSSVSIAMARTLRRRLGGNFSRPWCCSYESEAAASDSELDPRSSPRGCANRSTRTAIRLRGSSNAHRIVHEFVPIFLAG